MDILDTRFAGNRLEEWARAGLVFVGLWLAFILLSRIFLRRLKGKATSTGWVNELALSEAGKLAFPVFLPCSLIVASRFLDVSPKVHALLLYLLTAGITFCVVRFCQSLIGRALDRAHSEAQGARRSELAAVRNLSSIFNAVIWVLAALFLLGNAGIDVSGALAGFGIGGIAIALSAQRILGDLFASIGILVDKPFRIGDLIGAHDPMTAFAGHGSDEAIGTIERIGLKSTRIRGANGEELILSNSSLSASRISNFSRATRRRVGLKIEVSSSTGAGPRRALPRWIAEALATVPRTELEAAQFTGFGESHLTYEVSFFVPVNDPGFTLDTQHEANLAIFERLEREGVVLALEAAATSAAVRAEPVG